VGLNSSFVILCFYFLPGFVKRNETERNKTEKKSETKRKVTKRNEKKMSRLCNKTDQNDIPVKRKRNKISAKR
jgi:hypothetical protein